MSFKYHILNENAINRACITTGFPISQTTQSLLLLAAHAASQTTFVK